MISVKKLTLQINKKTLLQNVSCEIMPNNITAFIGESGAGKTSLLKCLANIYSDYSGQITYDGKDLKKIIREHRAATIGFISQQYNLFSHMTVFQNCAHPLMSVNGYSATDACKSALKHLGYLKVSELKDAYPKNLSGGQQQRVAIARALSLEPRVILLDEPTAALDPQNKNFLKALLKELANNGCTIIMSCHDLDFVQTISDKVYTIRAGIVD